MLKDEPYRRQVKKVSRGKWFLLGALTGLIGAVLLALAAGLYAVKNPGIILNGVAGRSVEKVVSATLQSIPRETIKENHEEIVEAVRQLSYAYAEDRLPSDTFRDLSSKTFAIVADRQVTPKEIDDLIRSIKRYTK